MIVSKYTGEATLFDAALRKALLGGASALALTTLSTPAWSQTAPADAQQVTATDDQNQIEADAQDEGGAIVVTGLRASLASAQSIKQNSDQFVDSITAIDIGKLPDKNVAEALQRISGIQITRNRGEGSQIAIRGLTQVRTEVNGRDSFGASGGRSLGFEDVPSELLAGVDVYKNPSAQMIEGGIGGTVNLRTRMPFDQEKTLITATIGANYYDLAEDARFNGSVMLSKTFETGIGKIGILLDYAHFEGTFRTDEIVIEPYVDTVLNGTTRSVPTGAGTGVTWGNRKRDGYYGAIQWAPSDNVEVYAQAFRSKYFIETPNYTSFVTRGTDAEHVNGLVPLPGFQFDNDGVFQAGGFSGFVSDWSLAPTWSNRNQLNLANNSQVSYNESETTDWSGGVKWQINDRLKLNVDLQYVKATAENRSYTAFAQHDLASYFIDMTGGLPQITFGGVQAIPGTGAEWMGVPPQVTPIDITNAAYYHVTALMDHKEDSDANQKTARADLEWDFDDSFLKSLTFGVRFTDRSAINRSTPYAWSGSTATTPLTDSRLMAINNPYDSVFFGGGGYSVGGVPFVGASALNEDTVAALFQSVVGRGLTEYSTQDINTQSEKTYGGYVMAHFGFDAGSVPIDGNIGVRVVHTDNTATGSTRLTYRPDLLPTTSQVTVDQPFSESQSYTRALPSLNLRAHLTDKLQARFAASKGLARPDFYDMRAIRNFSINYTQITDSSGTVLGYQVTPPSKGSGGNPLLKPLETNQVDASLEWYPKSTTMLYGTIFYKDLKNFVYDTLSNVPYEVPGQGTYTFQYTAKVNGTNGTVKGFEIGGNTFFDFLPGALSGFGIQGNVTYVDSNAPGAGGTLLDGTQVATPLQGLSKWSYNIVGLYQKYGLSVRAAYNWRDDYLETNAGNGTGGVPIYRRAYGQLDGSISYDFSRNVSVSIDGVNLLRARQESYQNIPENPRFYRLEDRRIGFSIRVRN